MEREMVMFLIGLAVCLAWYIASIVAQSRDSE